MNRSVIPTVGPWTFEHSIGAAVVFAIAAGFALSFWPGWKWLANWLW